MPNPQPKRKLSLEEIVDTSPLLQGSTGGGIDDLLRSNLSKTEVNDAIAKALDIPTMGEAGSIIKDSVDRGLASFKEVASPESLPVLADNPIGEAIRQLQGREARPRNDGSVDGPYNPMVNAPGPVGEAAKATVVDPRAKKAVDLAQSQGVQTVSSGFDEATNTAWAIGKDKDGKTVRIDAPGDPILKNPLRERLNRKRGIGAPAPVAATPETPATPFMSNPLRERLKAKKAARAAAAAPAPAPTENPKATSTAPATPEPDATGVAGVRAKIFGENPGKVPVTDDMKREYLYKMGISPEGVDQETAIQRLDREAVARRLAQSPNLNEAAIRGDAAHRKYMDKVLALGRLAETDDTKKKEALIQELVGMGGNETYLRMVADPGYSTGLGVEMFDRMFPGVEDASQLVPMEDALDTTIGQEMFRRIGNLGPESKLPELSPAQWRDYITETRDRHEAAYQEIRGTLFFVNLAKSIVQGMTGGLLDPTKLREAGRDKDVQALLAENMERLSLPGKLVVHGAGTAAALYPYAKLSGAFAKGLKAAGVASETAAFWSSQLAMGTLGATGTEGGALDRLAGAGKGVLFGIVSNKTAERLRELMASLPEPARNALAESAGFAIAGRVLNPDSEIGVDASLGLIMGFFSKHPGKQMKADIKEATLNWETEFQRAKYDGARRRAEARAESLKDPAIGIDEFSAAKAEGAKAREAAKSDAEMQAILDKAKAEGPQPTPDLAEAQALGLQARLRAKKEALLGDKPLGIDEFSEATAAGAATREAAKTEALMNSPRAISVEDLLSPSLPKPDWPKIGIPRSGPGSAGGPIITPPMTARLAERAPDEAKDAMNVLDYITRPVKFVGKLASDSWRALTNDFLPRHVKSSPAAADAGARLVAAGPAAEPWAKWATTYVTQGGKVDRKLLGAALSEDNLRDVKRGLQTKLEEARVAGDTARADYLYSLLNDPEMGGVYTFVGKDKPFATEKDYQDFLARPDVKVAILRHNEVFADYLEPLYMKAMELVEGDAMPPKSRGVQTQARINLLGYYGHEVPAETAARIFATQNRGDPGNIKRRKSPYGREATGTKDYYEPDYQEIMTAAFARQAKPAYLKEYYDALLASGDAKYAKDLEAESGSDVANWTIKGEKARAFSVSEPLVEVHETGDHTTKKVVKPEQQLYIRESLLPEFRQVTRLDTKTYVPESVRAVIDGIHEQSLSLTVSDNIVNAVNAVTVLATRNSTGLHPAGDAVASLFARIPDLAITGMKVAYNFTRLVANTESVQKEVADIARIGGWRERSRIKINGKEVESAGWKWDPKLKSVEGWLPLPFNLKIPINRFLERITEASRLTLDQAYRSLAEKGIVPNTEHGRRDYVNQMGNYLAGGMHPIYQTFKDAGVQPFMTAVKTRLSNAGRTLTLQPGTEATTKMNALWLRTALFSKWVGAIFAAGLHNYLTVGDPRGRAGVPLFAWDSGADDQNGDPVYSDPFTWIGLRQPLNYSGVGKAIDAKRRGLTDADAFDAGVKGPLNAATGLIAGPIPNLISTTASGENLYGYRMSETAGHGESQILKNAAAAFWGFSPFFEFYADTVNNATGKVDKPFIENLRKLWEKNIAYFAEKKGQNEGSVEGLQRKIDFSKVEQYQTWLKKNLKEHLDEGVDARSMSSVWADKEIEKYASTFPEEQRMDVVKKLKQAVGYTLYYIEQNKGK